MSPAPAKWGNGPAHAQNGTVNGQARPPAASTESLTTVPASRDSDLNDMRLQLQQLLLSTDLVLQSRPGSTGPGSRRVVAPASDDYLEQLAPIIKDALEKDGADDLVETLEGLQRLKDREINQICSGNHNEYMESIHKLDQVAQQTTSIKSTIVEVNRRLQKTGTELLVAKKQYLSAKTTHDNVTRAVGSVEACLQVLELTNNIHELLRSKQKFAALKSVEDLRNVHLQDVSDFGFAHLFTRSLPALSNMVRTEAVADTDAWLSDLQQRSPLVGRDIFTFVRRQKKEWARFTKEHPDYNRFKFNSPVEIAYRDSWGNYLTNDAIELDVSILYEAVLVHSSMGLLAEFQRHFESDRKIQRDYLVPNTIESNTSGSGELLDPVTDILLNVTGFCVIDRIISRRLPSFRPSHEVDEIWDVLSQKLAAKLSAFTKTISDPEVLRELKSLLGTFSHALQSYAFNTAAISVAIFDLFKQYSTILSKQFEVNFLQTVQKDDYMPMAIEDEEVYEAVSEVSWYTPSATELEKPFPRIVPFSEMYPLCCTELQTFINHHQSFLEDMQDDPRQVEDVLESSVDHLLNDVVCKSLEERLASTTREQIVQILVNLEYFENASRQLEVKLCEERISGRKGKATLEATQAFAQARKKAEERIFELLNSIIDNFLDIADYDWATTEKRDSPSDFLSEMATYLETMVNSVLVNLPRSVKSFVYLDAFDHLGSSLLQFLMDSGDSITLESVENFDIDVQYLEDFVAGLSSDANDASLMTIFTELRQCVDLLLTDNIEDYNNPTVRMKRFDRIKPEDAQALFAKVSYARGHVNDLDPSQANSVPPGSPRSPMTTSSRFRQMYQRGVGKLNERVN